MDFKNKKYYLVCKNGESPELPHILKVIFPCKIHCSNFYYNETRYTCCVSIDSKLAKRLIGYFKIVGLYHNGDYEEIAKQPYYQDRQNKKWKFETIDNIRVGYAKEMLIFFDNIEQQTDSI